MVYPNLNYRFPATDLFPSGPDLFRMTQEVRVGLNNYHFGIPNRRWIG